MSYGKKEVKSLSESHWMNLTGIPDPDIRDYLGFIYRISNVKEGWYYYGRKQFWRKSGKYYTESDWRSYCGSSKSLPKYIAASVESDLRFEMLSIFTSKSAIRYGEALSIISSGAYEDTDRGVNWSFDGCRGKLKFELTDREQLEHLKGECSK